MGTDVDYLYDLITLGDLLKAIEGSPAEAQLSRRLTVRVKRNKKSLIDVLINEGPYWREKLFAIAADNEDEKLRKRREKRGRHIEHVRDARQEAYEKALNAGFLDLPSPDEFLNIYTQFYEATSNAALKQLICAVCARLLNALDADITAWNINEIPNRERLRPQTHHNMCELTHGYLLEAKGCFQDESDTMVNVCRECCIDLQVCFNRIQYISHIAET